MPKSTPAWLHQERTGPGVLIAGFSSRGAKPATKSPKTTEEMVIQEVRSHVIFMGKGRPTNLPKMIGCFVG